MRVLITGKNGQVGNSLVTELDKQEEIDFLALDRTELDIANAEKVNTIVNDFSPDMIINAAAYTAVDKAESDEEQANTINCLGSRNLAIAASRINACLLHLSTDYVFSGDKSGMYTETDAVNPQGIYGKTKLSGEQAIVEVCPAHIILRTAWVFGEHGNNFVKTMLKLAQTRATLGVVGDQFGGPTYAGDIASTLISIAKAIHSGNKAYGIYHYSGFPHVSWQEFASEIFSVALAKKEIPAAITVNAITTADYLTPAKRPANSKLDCTKIMDNFSIQPSNWKAALNNIQQYK